MPPLSLDDVRLGDVVRLRNGETIRVRSKSLSYGDRTGEHEGPFVSDRSFSHFLLADVVEVVERNDNACVFCGEGVTSRNPEVDYCEGCFYSCRSDARTFADLLAKLDALDGVREASFWHTGGGCKLLAVSLVDGRLVTCTEGEASLPESGEPWRLAIVSESEEAFDDYDDARMVIYEDLDLDEDELVAWIEALYPERTER